MVLSVSDSTIKVYNAALVRLGVPKINSFIDESISARTGNEMFEDVLENALCLYPWRFSTRRMTLNRLAATAPGDWEGLYNYPTEARHVWKVYEDDTLSQDWEVFERTVAVNINETSTVRVTADATVMVGPSQWPGYFRLPFINFLAAEICMPITQDDGMAANLANKADVMMQRAASRDSQARTPSRVNTKMFINQRRSRGRA